MLDPSMNCGVRNDFLRRLVVEVFRDRLTEQDSLLLMALLHMYRVILSHPISNLDKAVTYFEALTQRSAATVVAALWPQQDDPRSTYWYWYWKWNADWRAYQHLETLSPAETQRLNQLKRLLETHAAVRCLEPEEWDLVRPMVTVDVRDQEAGLGPSTQPQTGLLGEDSQSIGESLNAASRPTP